MYNSRENHPTKIFRREKWISLNGEWDFFFDNKQEFNSPKEIVDWNLKIIVPFSPESEASGIGNTNFHSRCWYKKKFVHRKNNERVILHFGAVDYFTEVWLNGK